MHQLEELLRTLTGGALTPRGINRRKVFLALAIKADTQVGVARRTLLSQATVSAAVRELERIGLVQSAGGGRVGLVPADAVSVGVHLEYDHVTVVARRLDRPFDQVALRQVDGGLSRGWRHILPIVKKTLLEAIEETGLGPKEVFSLGIATPRMINPRTGEFAWPLLYPWRPGDDPASDLGAWLGVRAVIDNDGNLGALAEATYDIADAETLVYVKASTDIGAGIIVHNTLMRGHGGMAGEIGHLTIDPDGAVCQCGGRGCLETVIGTDALVTQARAVRPRNAGIDAETLDGVIRAAKEGDLACRRVIQDAGRALGRSLAQMCAVINPERIVVGGRLATCGPLLLDECREAVGRYGLPGAAAETTLTLSELNGLSEAQGALVLGLRAQEAYTP